MKKTLSIFGIAALLIGIAALSSFQNSSDTSNYLYVRVFEANGLYSSTITITDGQTLIKKVELEKFHEKNMENNLMKITKILNELKSQGYKITSTSGGGIGSHDVQHLITNYVFVKE